MKKRFYFAPFIFLSLDPCHPKNTGIFPLFTKKPIALFRRKNFFEKRRAS